MIEPTASTSIEFPRTSMHFTWKGDGLGIGHFPERKRSCLYLIRGATSATSKTSEKSTFKPGVNGDSTMRNTGASQGILLHTTTAQEMPDSKLRAQDVADVADKTPPWRGE